MARFELAGKILRDIFVPEFYSRSSAMAQSIADQVEADTIISCLNETGTYPADGTLRLVHDRTQQNYNSIFGNKR